MLDDTFRLFRQGWPALLLVMSIAAVVRMALTAVQGWFGVFSFPVPIAPTVPPGGRFAPGIGVPPGRIALFVGVILASSIVSLVAILPSTIAVVRLTDGMMRGMQLSAGTAWRAYVASVQRLWPAFAAGLLVALAMVGLTVVSIALWAIELFVVGAVIAFIGLIVWGANPRARRNWLRWLIVLTTPYGLAIYFFYKWSLAFAAIVLEGASAMAALRRSSALVRGSWFRVFGVIIVLGVIVYILQVLPGFVVSLPLTASRIGAAIRNPTAPIQPDVLATVVTSAANALGLALFGALPVIGLTVLFIDVRNRRDGTDLAERIDALGQQAAAASFTSPALG